MEGWVDLGDQLHTKVVYHPQMVMNPSTNPAVYGRESNSWPIDHKSNALTTSLPSQLASKFLAHVLCVRCVSFVFCFRVIKHISPLCGSWVLVSACVSGWWNTSVSPFCVSCVLVSACVSGWWNTSVHVVCHGCQFSACVSGWWNTSVHLCTPIVKNERSRSTRSTCRLRTSLPTFLYRTNHLSTDWTAITTHPTSPPRLLLEYNDTASVTR